MTGPKPNYYILTCLAGLLLTLWGWSPDAHARTVYQYVDQQGAMAYSDEPPQFTSDYIVIELPDPAPAEPGETENTIEQMVEVTERLEASRKAREEERRQREAPQPPPVARYPEQDDDDGRGYFYPGNQWNPPDRRARPPFRVDQPENRAQQRRQELKTPIRIPGFGTSEPLHQRLEPFDPPPAPPRRR